MRNSSIHIRTPTYDDAPRLARLQLRVIGDTYVDTLRIYTSDDVRKLYGDELILTESWCAKLEQARAKPKTYFLEVACSENDIVGYIHAWLKQNRSKIILSKLYIDTEYQGRGVALELMQHLFLWANATPIFVLVEHTNERAIRFYQKHGFVLTGGTHQSRGMSSVWLKTHP